VDLTQARDDDRGRVKNFVRNVISVKDAARASAE
jgi:hypothetical protein